MGFSSETHLQIQERLLAITEEVREGFVEHLDALIEMRMHKDELARSIEIIDQFERENIDAIAIKASAYGGKYGGFEIKHVNGRKTYAYKGIPEWEEVDMKKKAVESKFKTAFEAFQKGAMPTEEVDGVLYWVDTDGQLNPFPELSIGKSYLTLKKQNI